MGGYRRPARATGENCVNPACKCPIRDNGQVTEETKGMRRADKNGVCVVCRGKGFATDPESISDAILFDGFTWSPELLNDAVNYAMERLDDAA